MKSYVFGLFTNYLSLGLHGLVHIILMPLMLRDLGQELTGVYLIQLTLLNFLGLGIGWLGNAGIRYIGTADVSEEEGRVKEIHNAIFFGFLFYGLITFLCAAASTFFVGTLIMKDADLGVQMQVSHSLWYLGGYFLFYYVFQADLAFLTSTLRIGTSNLWKISTQLLFIALVFAFSFYGLRVDRLILAHCVSALIPMLALRIFLAFRGEIFLFSRRLPPQSVRREIFYFGGSQYLFFSMLQSILHYADVLILGWLGGASLATKYVLVWKIAEFFALVLERITEILIPYITRLDGEKRLTDIRSLYCAFQRLLVLFVLAISLSYGFFGSAVVTVWVGPEHAPDNSLLYVVASLALFIRVVNRHDVALHYALAKLRSIFPVLIVESLLKICLLFALYPFFGYISPLLSYVLIQIVGIMWWYKVQSFRSLELSFALWKQLFMHFRVKEVQQVLRSCEKTK